MTRMLEIGPGREPAPGFEGYDVKPGHKWQGPAEKLPFADGTFDHVYSAHCLEHCEWIEVPAIVCEWARVVKPGGRLTVHTVNAAPLMEQLLRYERTGDCDPPYEKWMKRTGGDVFLAWQMRIMNYCGKGRGRFDEHRAILVPRYFRQCFEQAGLSCIEDAGEPLGRHKHWPINMGLTGVKPC